MLHILWMILKFILIVLGILLSLIMLLLLLALFCPVRYRAEAAGNLDDWKRTQISVSVSWLFRGIILKIRLEEGKAKHSIRILGIPLEKLKRKKINKKSFKRKKTDSDVKTKEKEKVHSDDKIVKEENMDSDAVTPEKQSSDFCGKMLEEQQQKQEITPGTTPEAETISPVKTVKKEKRILPEEKQKEKRTGPIKRIGYKVSAFLDKLKKIPAAIRNFTSKIQGIYDKISYWKQFLSHPRVKEAFSFFWFHAKKLLKHIFPTRIQGHVTFGCEDPSITGSVLAILGITIPFHKNCIEITPVFEGTNLLKGDVKMRGRIYGIILVKSAVQIYFNKNIKYVLNRWRHKEESL